MDPSLKIAIVVLGILFAAFMGIQIIGTVVSDDKDERITLFMGTVTGVLGILLGSVIGYAMAQ